jgi:hypothetical protein
MASIGVTRRPSDAVATPSCGANGTAKEWADFPLILLAWSGDGL